MTDDLLQPDRPIQQSYLDNLVGEGRKFKTPEDLAKGKYLADEYIGTLESQLDVYRDEILKLREHNVAQAKIGDLVDQLNMPREKTLPTVTEQKPSIDPTQFESFIDKRIQEREASRRQTENYNLVKSKIEERLGKDYQNALQERITELDIAPEHLTMMAKTNPKAALRLLGLDQPPQQDMFQAPPGTRFRTDSFKPAVQERTWSWYQNLKNTEPKKYYNPSTNVQMHRDMQSLGERFMDGDFNAFGQDHRIKY